MNIMQNTKCQDINKIKKNLNKADGDEKIATEKILRKMNKKKTLQTKYPEQVKFLIINGVKKPSRMFLALE